MSRGELDAMTQHLPGMAVDRERWNEKDPKFKKV
jgi:hypothetical protein